MSGCVWRHRCSERRLCCGLYRDSRLGDLVHVCLQDLAPPLHVRVRHHHMPARGGQDLVRRWENIAAAGRSATTCLSDMPTCTPHAWRWLARTPSSSGSSATTISTHSMLPGACAHKKQHPPMRAAQPCPRHSFPSCPPPPYIYMELPPAVGWSRPYRGAPVKAPRPHQRLIKHLSEVGGCDDDDALRCLLRQAAAAASTAHAIRGCSAFRGKRSQRASHRTAVALLGLAISPADAPSF